MLGVLPAMGSPAQSLWEEWFRLGEEHGPKVPIPSGTLRSAVAAATRVTSMPDRNQCGPRPQHACQWPFGTAS